MIFNLLALLITQIQDIKFDDYFVDKTMRVDMYITGNHIEEVITLDEIIVEDIWAGSKTNLIDYTGYGCEQVRIYHTKSSRMIYSRGFCTLFGEWQTTDEAKVMKRTFHNTVRFPYPKDEVELVIGVGQKKLFSMKIDPLKVRAKKLNPSRHENIKLHYSGECSKNLDIIILPEGYTKTEEKKMIKDAERYTGILLSSEPYSYFKNKINIWLVKLFSNESGVSEPRKGIYKDTALNLTFNTFEIERYLTAPDNKRVRNAAAHTCYDTILIMVNTNRYGGAGIFNQWAIFPSDNEYDDYVFLHELGHSFAGLADEYYTSKVAYSDFYPKGLEPWEPNITAYLKRDEIKWGNLIKKGIPIPTPEKEEYKNQVGLFEGAGYAAKDLYRPMMDCKMFSKGSSPFCVVCKASIEKMIKFYSE
ncbi:MAG: IgA Peptidase M64 [Deltaproteobacteria bacterium]|nr:IgA Peptidase M64 [Deltaproteobacteria bacterium]